MGEKSPEISPASASNAVPLMGHHSRSDAIDGLCPVGAFCSLHKIVSLQSMSQEDEPNAYWT